MAWILPRTSEARMNLKFKENLKTLIEAKEKSIPLNLSVQIFNLPDLEDL